MVKFADILGDVEFVSEPLSWRVAHDAFNFAIIKPSELENFPSTELAGARARLANDVYTLSKAEADQDRAGTSAPGQAIDFRKLIARLDGRGLTRQELGALRRELAWLFHPDRSADKVEANHTMAELNARIDGLVERMKRSRSDRKRDSSER